MKHSILNTMTPIVIEQDSQGRERAYDIFSRLMKDRIIFIGTPIDDSIANAVVAQLLFLSGEDEEKPIDIFINSPGGSITAGMAIIDTMNYVTAPIRTNVVGMAASMAAVILACGDKGKRFALPNSEVLIHQPSGGIGGQATDIDLYARHIIKTREKLNNLLVERTGQSYEKIAKDVDRDFVMTAEQAVEYGIVDKIVRKAPSRNDDDDE